MNKNINKKKLIRFLKENNIFYQFQANLIQYNVNATLNEHIEDLEYEDALINSAFSWGATNEGTYFWKKYNYKWKNYLERENIIHI